MITTYYRLNLPVWASTGEVIRASSLKLKKRYRFSREQRDARHAFYREMLEHHHAGLVEYRAVTSGRLR